MHHILVTNDFPPKLGGIQTYLWDLWSRLPAESFTVVTPDHPGAEAWDRSQPFAVQRVRTPVLVPGPALARTINELVRRNDADLVLLDPVVHTAPLVGRIDAPYGVVVHGAEVVVPAAVPFAQLMVRRSLRGASMVVAAGNYPAQAAERAAGRPLPTVVVPPGVDAGRFAPLDASRRAAARQRFGVDADAPLIVSVSRLVPRKGMDQLIRASVRLAVRHPDLRVLVAGEGRDRDRLQRLIDSLSAPVELVDRLDADDLPEFYGMADVFAMLCRNRWVGLEQEGFGIVFLEAAACGVAQVAGDSGGARDAVDHGTTGLVVDDPGDLDEVTSALGSLLDDRSWCRQLGQQARQRAAVEFDRDRLAGVLHDAVVSCVADLHAAKAAIHNGPGPVEAVRPDESWVDGTGDPGWPAGSGSDARG
jgi:phosphatidylinositol alpha-1,6-mannosyltransferase